MLRVSVDVSVKDSSRYVFRETKESIHAVHVMCKLPSFYTFQVCGSFVFGCDLLNLTEGNAIICAI